MNSQPSPQEAARELLDRRMARRSLEQFTTYTYPRYQVEPFHALVAATLDRVVSGEIKRLMVFAPPQHGKSELTSVRLPAFWLGRRPDDPVIIASYGADLAESKSRQARTIVESAEFGNLFPGIATRRDSRAVNRWELAGYRGSLLAVGVGGPITGHGALLGIIDDPVQNWQAAQSEILRESNWEWYRTTFRTRIWEGGAIVLIMTRWHEDDLAGRLLREQPRQWTVLRLPALAESQKQRDTYARGVGLPDGELDPLGRSEGEPLSPGRFSVTALAELQSDVGPTAWAAEYQGTPTPAEGGIIKVAWFRRTPLSADKPIAVYQFWDTAFTRDKQNDMSAGGTILEYRDRWRLDDLWYGRLEFNELKKTAKELFDLRKPRAVVVESKASGIVLLQEWRRESRLPILGYNPDKDGDKIARAYACQPLLAAGRVEIPVDAPWVEAFLHQCTVFPNGDHDDLVDVLTMFLIVLGVRRQQQGLQQIDFRVER